MSLPPDRLEMLRRKCEALSNANNKSFVLVTGKLVSASSNPIPTHCFPGAKCYDEKPDSKSLIIIQGQLANSNVAQGDETISFALDALDSDSLKNIEERIGAKVGFCGVKKEPRKPTNSQAYNIPDNKAFLLFNE